LSAAEQGKIRFELSELLDLLRGEGLLADDDPPEEDLALEGFSAISHPRPKTVSWVRREPESWPEVSGLVVIAPPELETLPGNGLVARVTNPRLAFAKALRHFARPPRPTGVEPTAVRGKDTVLGEDVYLGHGAVIGDGVTIGDRTVIHENVVIKDGCHLGRDCTIHPGAVIGSDGFGYVQDEDGEWIKFEHIGDVVIEDEVEIGANTCVDRAALSTTRIKRGAKIDNHCHIGHNSTVGERAIVTAQCMVGGHVEIEENAWIAPGAVLHNETRIGEGALVGYSALVLKDVPPGQVVAGVPAKVIKSRAETRW
jgi:UDP-3-O-[3-hydroxymyristoyl] glucosamine N-acyltransferase